MATRNTAKNTDKLTGQDKTDAKWSAFVASFDDEDTSGTGTGTLDAENRNSIPTVSKKKTTGTGTKTTRTDVTVPAYTAGYVPGTAVTDALSEWRSKEEAVNSIAPYTGDDSVKDAYTALSSRGKFSYDPTGDALYRMYRDLYAENARSSTLDAQGQAAALTGGYGNSYAASAGAAAYDQQMTRLNDRLLDLYDRAYDRWQDEGTSLETQYEAAADMADRDYDRWSDALERAQAERQYAGEVYQDAYEREYGEYRDKNSQAYELVMEMIREGLTPSAEILASAGINAADLETLLKYYSGK